MKPSGSKEFLKLVEALARSSEQMQSAAEALAQGMSERRSEFEQKKRNLEDSIKHGAKLTKHRISL